MSEEKEEYLALSALKDEDLYWNELAEKVEEMGEDTFYIDLIDGQLYYSEGLRSALHRLTFWGLADFEVENTGKTTGGFFERVITKTKYSINDRGEDKLKKLEERFGKI